MPQAVKLQAGCRLASPKREGAFVTNRHRRCYSRIKASGLGKASAIDVRPKHVCGKKGKEERKKREKKKKRHELG